MNNDQLDIIVRAQNLAGGELAALSGQVSALEAKATGASAAFNVMKIALAATAVAVVGIGIVATKAAATFQEGMTSLVTGAGEAESNIELVSKGILGLATATGTSTKQLTDGMYMIESAGFHGAAGLDVLKASAEGAKVGNADLGVVADATTTILKDFGNTGITASGAVNTLVATVANGKTHMADLAMSLSQVLPTASAAGIGLNDVMGAMATMTGEGVPAANAATYLRQTLINLVAPGSAAKKALQEVGLTSAQVSDEMKVSLPDTLKMITEAVGKKFPEGSAAYVEAIKTISGGAKTMQGMLDLTGQHLSTFNSNVKTVGDSVTSAGDKINGWGNVQQDFNFKLSQANEIVQTAMIQIGTNLLPVLTGAVAGFTDWYNAVDGLNGIFGPMIDSVTQIATQVGDYLNPKLSALWNTVQSDLIPALQNLWQDIIIPLSGAIGTILVEALGLAVDALKFIITVFSNFVNGVKSGNIAMTLLAIGLASLVAGFIIYRTTLAVVATATTIYTGLTVALSAVQAIQVQGIGFVRAAWIALDIVMAANPIGLVIAAVAGLVAVLAALSFSTNKSESEEKKLDDQRVASLDIAKRLKDGENELKDARYNQEGAALAVEQAQNTLNDAVKRGGVTSLDAREAAHELEGAQQRLKDANDAVTASTRKITDAQQANIDKTNEVIKSLDKLNGKSVTYYINGQQMVAQKMSNGQAITTATFADGGYTGTGGKNEIAGTVHKGEYVLPQSAVNQSTGKPKANSEAVGNTTHNTQTVTIGTVILGSADAVTTFFNKLDQDSILVGKGLTPNRGAY